MVPRVAAATGPVAYVRFHGRNAKTWNIRSEKSADRFDWMYSAAELADWVPELGRLAGEADEVYAMFNNNRDDFAPRSAMLLRGLLDESGIAADGRHRAAAAPADPVLIRKTGLRSRGSRSPDILQRLLRALGSPVSVSP